MADLGKKKPVVERRKKIFVDANIQSALIRQMVYNWLLLLGVIAAVLLCVESYRADFALSVYGCVAAMCSKNAALLITLTILAPVIIYESVKLSHRFVGPMVSFRRALTRLADGEHVDPIRFREGDYWHDLAERFNRVVDRVEQLEAANCEHRQDVSLGDAAEIEVVSQG